MKPARFRTNYRYNSSIKIELIIIMKFRFVLLEGVQDKCKKYEGVCGNQFENGRENI